MRYNFCLFILLIVAGCSFPSINEIDLSGEYAIPLINDRITFESLVGQSDQFDVFMDTDGKLILRYKAELLSDNIQNLLPSIPSIGEVVITDTLSYFPLTTSDNFVISRAILSGDEMRFRYSHDIDEDLTVNMKIPELTKNGKIFEFDYALTSPGGGAYSSFTESFNLAGYEFVSDENQLTFLYDARNPSGERIKLVFAAMSFNELNFSFGEGSFERTPYPLEGDSLAVSVFNGWRSGEIEFEDPSMHFEVTHSFGFPISIQIDEVSLTTVNNDVKLLSWEFIGQEIPLNYPQLSEVGSSSVTNILLDRANSNINTLFNQKIKFIDYNVNAVINPTGNLETKGFVTDESSFTLDVSLDIPLSQKVNNLIIADTIAIAQLLPDEFSEVEFKVITENTYPIRMTVNFVFLDENGNELERLLGNEPLIVEPSQEKTTFINLDESKISKLKQARRIVIEPNFDTSAISDDFVQFLADQYMELRVGLKFKI